MVARNRLIAHYSPISPLTLHTSTIFVTSRYCTTHNNPPRYAVTCEINGTAHPGTYWIVGKILTVSTGMGGESKQVGSTPAEIPAKQLRLRLAQEGNP